MDYQLVLQFQGDSLGDFDAMVALEDELSVLLADSADIDGHDIGSGQANIFIFSFNPTATFDRPSQRWNAGGIYRQSRQLTEKSMVSISP